MTASRKLWLLFLGRLEKEKGFDLIFDYITQYSDKELPFEIYIFWIWSYENGILDLASKYKQIHYFWWKPLSEVERFLDNIDYCLMPSRFLETFGLSAINVLKWWIPVVGFKKWWLTPFIQDEYAIDKCPWTTELRKFSAMLEKLEEEKKAQKNSFYVELAGKSKAVAGSYSKERWFKVFQSLTFDFKVKKIVMVSDFINKIGGIETYIHDVKSLLEEQWYEVVLYGNTCPKGILGKLKKFLGIWLGLFNVTEGIKFKKFLQKEQPQLIWYHSMLRWMGWFPIFCTRNYKAKRRMMYHDFWYFVPYPHALENTKEVHQLSLRNYLRWAHTYNPLKLLLVIGKYCSLKLLSIQLKKYIDLHLVPSDFMIPVVERSFQMKQNVKAFNHFLQD